MNKSKYFTSLDYRDKRSAMASLAEQLMARDWKVYDYHPDTSDSMTDYFNPASWDGIATRGNMVLVVNQSSANKSGKEISQTDRTYTKCGSCAGTGADPDPEAWTLQQARQNPEAFNNWKASHTKGAIPMMPTVVSPLHFTEGGKLKCQTCKGTGKQLVSSTTSVVDHYPVYQANPPRKAWHLEHNGNILLDGMSIAKLSPVYWEEGDKAAAQAIAEFIADVEKVIGAPVSTVLNAKPAQGIEIVVYSEKAIAVKGDTYPIKDVLKGLGGKFNKFLKAPDGTRYPGWIFHVVKTDEVKRALNVS